MDSTLTTVYEIVDMAPTLEPVRPLPFLGTLRLVQAEGHPRSLGSPLFLWQSDKGPRHIHYRWAYDTAIVGDIVPETINSSNFKEKCLELIGYQARLKDGALTAEIIDAGS